LVHPVPRRVADVERLHRALPELRDRLLAGGGRRRAGPAAAARLGHQHPELLLAQHERLQQAPDPRDGQEVLLLPAAAGSPQVREVRGDVGVELLDIGVDAGRRHPRRGGRGRGVAAEGEEGAAEGGERGGVGVGRRGGALEVRGRHGLGGGERIKARILEGTGTERDGGVWWWWGRFLPQRVRGGMAAQRSSRRFCDIGVGDQRKLWWWWMEEW
ncbi:hypothetical protein BAE44_0022898, partial [Dichanthelium oligosanthes]